jgi:E3 ubiquitin-protein ligase RNF115/126
MLKKPEDNFNNEYNMKSITKCYWCHLCKKEFNRLFVENSEVHCRQCGKTFCEEILGISQDDHPSNYQPFEQRRRDRHRESNPILDILSSLMFNEDAHMENIINYLMANDPNKYGNPPASKDEIDRLTKLEVNKDNKSYINQLAGESGCSVCKEDYEYDQTAIKLPCSHIFHDECILPWLKERNSCPTCRFELKTDDKDYEDRKFQKRNEIRSSAQNHSSQSLGN